MHAHIKKLYQIADKPSRLIVGLMSGTSLDGLDVALCKITGAGAHSQVEVLNFTTVDYDGVYQEKIRQVFAKRQVDLQMVTLLNAWIGELHGNMVLQCLQQWQISPQEVDIIASHGQTIFHCPKSQHGLAEFSNATLQIGDGDHVAVTTGIITLADFRQKHVASGGEGAPLATYGDHLLFSDANENRILLNLGGIANFTFLPKRTDADNDNTKNGVFSSDIGPSNTLMDAYVQQHFSGLRYDQDSRIAKSGTVNNALLKALKANEFFSRALPKTTGPEVFNLAYLAQAQQVSNTGMLATQDVMATLNRFSADTIVAAIKSCTNNTIDFSVYASGGGIYNQLLMESIAEQLTVKIHSTEVLAISPDAKEAVLFAVLANECLVGSNELTTKEQQQNSSKVTFPNVTMGKICFAD